MADVDFQKTKGVMKATIKNRGVSVQISFPAGPKDDEQDMEDGLKSIFAVLEVFSGREEAIRVMQLLQKKTASLVK